MKKTKGKKKNNKTILYGGLALVVLIIFDLINIGNYIPYFGRINYQLWNLVAVVGIFIFGFQYVDKRDLKRKESQERSGKLLIQLSYKNCKQMLEFLDSAQFKSILLSDFDGSAPFNDQHRYVGVRALPFENDEDIKKLAYEGVIDAEEFEQYVKVKSQYQNMVTMYFVAPDHPEIYKEQKRELLLLIPKNEKEKKNEALQNR